MIHLNLPVRLRQRNNREFFSSTASLAPSSRPGGRCEYFLTPTLLTAKNMHMPVAEDSIDVRAHERRC